MDSSFVQSLHTSQYHKEEPAEAAGRKDITTSHPDSEIEVVGRENSEAGMTLCLAAAVGAATLSHLTAHHRGIQSIEYRVWEHSVRRLQLNPVNYRVQQLVKKLEKV